MKHYLQSLLLLVATLLCTFTSFAAIPENCEANRVTNGWPEYYCECKYNYQRFNLPLDAQITDTVWYRAALSTLSNGVSAYLQADCEVSFDVYTGCNAKAPKYSAIFSPNNANVINSQTISEKLDEMGLGGTNVVFYICIAPINGKGGRLICTEHGKSFHSTCDDPLYLFAGSSFLSTNEEDIYVLDPANIPAATDLIFQWEEEYNAPCHLRITRGTCEGDVLTEVDFLSIDDYYLFTSEMTAEALSRNELLYFHFTHKAAAGGTIYCLTPNFNPVVTDTTLCQGKNLVIDGHAYTQTGYYPYDTIKYSDLDYDVLAYNLTVLTPDMQHDTLSLRNDQLPYLYRNQQSIDEFGDFDLLLHAEDQCDEHVLLHVRHALTTIVNEQDTFLCDGKTYTSPDGKDYVHPVSFTDSLWHNADTLFVDILHVHFNDMDVIYDTLAIKKLDLPYRYKGNTLRQFGDYALKVTDEHACPDSLYLHLCHGVQVDTVTVDTLLCHGTIYVHADGVEYTRPVVLIDSLWLNEDAKRVTITSVNFTTDELRYDTLALRHSQLPYTYRQQAKITGFGDTLVTIVVGECDERVQLHVIHDIVVLHQDVDTTLCQGLAYNHHGATYTQSVVLNDSGWVNADTYQYLTTRVWFTEPNTEYDTLALKTTDLPYLYEEQIISDFGNHNLLLHVDEQCDRIVQLYVYHSVDTLYRERDSILCQGLTFEYAGVQYTEPISYTETSWADADTYQYLTTNVWFSEPDLEYDTLVLKTTDMPYLYEGQQIADFGSHTLLLHTEDACDRLVQLYVRHQMTTITSTTDTTICYGGIFRYDGKLYKNDVVLVEQVQHNADTLFIDTLRVCFDTQAAVVQDTLVLSENDLPKRYRGKTITDFGDYEWEAANAQGCIEKVMLHVAKQVVVQLDTMSVTLCEGKSYNYNGTCYTSDTVVVDSLWLDQETHRITTLLLTFTPPVMEYDTVTVKTPDLQAGYYYELAGAYLYAEGVYEYTILVPDDCTRLISLTVLEEIVSALDELPMQPDAQVILKDGAIYIQRGGQCYTLLGERCK